MSYNGWMIPDRERARIFTMFAPRYPNHKCTHITLTLDIHKEFPTDAQVAIVGYIDDGSGVEALVVSVDGDIRRPDGLIYHITLSVADGRASKESNDVLATKPFTPVDIMNIETRAFFSHGDGPYVTTPLTGKP